ncbi:MAG: polymer-forming cytoskeletal protein [Endomicrobiia bacterium]
MAKINTTEGFTANMILAGTIITGDVQCNGDIRIDGSLNGNLCTKGKVVVGTTGAIKGDINCSNCDIEGNFEGKITVNELLSFKATARFIGEIITNKLAIEPGAIFSGSCNMKDRIENQVDTDKKVK